MIENKTHSNLQKTLKKLDFSFDDTALPEIVFLNNLPNNLHPKHHIALEFAEIYDADAVFFRYYSDNRYCVPQIYFYDNTLKNRTKSQVAEIHKKVYSSCQVPLICFIDNTTITIYDCRVPVKEKDGGITNEHCLFKDEKLSELENLSKYFSAKQLNYGQFWESDEASKHFLNNQSAYEKLIQVLSEIRSGFIKAFMKDIPEGFADDLLFKCILIKYLEENGKDGNYAEDFYKRNNLGYNSLNDILSNRKILELFDALERHFNGNVFNIEDTDTRNLLKTIDLSTLALHLEGKLNINDQSEIWSIYSFKDIPIELISNFYEEFVPKTEDNSGTVYTPSFLVNLLIDECLPLSNKSEDKNYNVKLIDVSCGSGIFITSAYKRLVQRWRIAKGENGKPLSKDRVKLAIAKKILSDNIFGVDKDETAVKLTKFSLQLALCQIVPNNELWNWSKEKVFDKLTDNIFERDFFDFLVENPRLHSSFDLVIGNPPFQSINNKNIAIYNDYISKLKSIGFEFKAEVPDRQLALMFLETSSLLLKERGDLCFIQKSTSLLYNKNDKSQQFKDHIFNQFHVHQIIDFTLLKNVLFKSSKVKKEVADKKVKNNSVAVESMAVFYKKEKKEDYTTNHIVSRLLKNTKDGLFFEFDYYDFHEVSKEQALNDENVWRCNLLGGNRLNHLVNSLEKANDNHVSLKSFLLENLKIEKERYSEGYMRGSGEDAKPSEFITSKLNLSAKNFSQDSYKLVELEPNQKFIRTRKEELLYTKPLITIKEEISRNKIPILFHTEDVPFDSRIVGISVPQKKQDELEGLFKILQENQRVYCLQTLATCAQFFLGSTSVIQKSDIDKWAIPLEGDEIKLSSNEKIVLNDALDYIYPSWYEGEKAEINKIIKDEKILLEFANTYCESINSIYKQKGKELQVKTIIEGDAFFACEFLYTSEKIEYQFIPDSDIEIDKLLKEQVGTNRIYNKIIRIDKNKESITFIKPKNLRYWLKSIALRDADDTFDDIIESGN